ncbi:hypothetical protein [Stappia indica]|uniref:Uncharacterized protein n=1 Tax=Stappia indica TaxID=538381 RepID=A0A857C4X2_9HYPH|nr:hypothetical protein [Stappia indica]QGZ33954.1 hypothetical protein GH266_05160 [Stappia indica]
MARKLFRIAMASLGVLAVPTVVAIGLVAVVAEIKHVDRRIAAARQCVMDAIATLPAAYPLDKIEYHCHQQARNTP